MNSINDPNQNGLPGRNDVGIQWDPTPYREGVKQIADVTVTLVSNFAAGQFNDQSDRSNLPLPGLRHFAVNQGANFAANSTQNSVNDQIDQSYENRQGWIYRLTEYFLGPI